MPRAKYSAKQELTKIKSNLKDSVAYMRDICSDSSLGVPKGKRVQRQVRYERLKDEFLSLIEKLETSEEEKKGPLESGERIEY